MSDHTMTFSDLAAAVENPYKGKNRFLVETLDEALADCARASAATRKKSSFTITVTLSPLGSDEVALSSTVKTKIPEKGALPVKAFLDKRGTLVADDPQQLALPVELAKKGAETQ